MRPSQILQNRRAEVLEIMKRYPRLSNLRVFGSVARGEDAENSDVDFLVDLAPGATLIFLPS
jgi:predicted nucleotidyltransferase